MTLEDIEFHTEGQIIARRNLRLGLWAGMRLGLRGERLTDYARGVMEEDFRIPGPDDVIGKIGADFAENGVDFPADLIGLELQRIERQVRSELLVTD